MGIRGMSLASTALALGMGACEADDNQKQQEEETQYGQATEALNANDPQHFGRPFRPENILQGDSDRNRSAVVIDGHREEFEFFVRDNRVFVQRCNLGPEQCNEPVEVPVLSFRQIASAFSVAIPNGDGTFTNRIYNSSNGAVESNSLTIDANGMPTANPDDLDGYREENMRGSIAPATMEMNGEMVEGILWNGGNGELNFHNPITRENTLLAENVAGLDFCGVSSRGLEYDFRRNDNSPQGCRIIIRAEVAVNTGLIGQDARSVEIPQPDGTKRRFIYFTDPATNTTQVVEILPYDGDGVCAPGEVEDCPVLPPDAGMGGAGGQGGNGGAEGGAGGNPAPDMNVSPPDAGLPLDAGMGGAGGNGGSGGAEGGAGGSGGQGGAGAEGGAGGQAGNGGSGAEGGSSGSAGEGGTAGGSGGAPVRDGGVSPDGPVAPAGDCNKAPDNFTIKTTGINPEDGKPYSNADCIEVCTDATGTILLDKVRVTGTGQCAAEVKFPGRDEPATLIIRGWSEDMQPIPGKPLDVTVKFADGKFVAPEVADVGIRFHEDGQGMNVMDARGNVSGSSASIIEVVGRTNSDIVDLVNDNHTDQRLIDRLRRGEISEFPDLVYTFANGQAAISVKAGERVRLTKSTGDTFPIGEIPGRPDAGVKDVGVPTPPTAPPTQPPSEPPTKHKKGGGGGCSVVLGMSDGTETVIPEVALSLIVAGILARVRRRRPQAA